MKNEEIVVYSLKCDHCIELEKRFNALGVPYVICDDFELMKQKGFKEVPMVEAFGKIMNMGQALRWAEKEFGNKQ